MGKLYRDLVQEQSRAKRGPRAVLNVLANYANRDGMAFPGYDTIAHDAGVSVRTVERHISTLREMGEIAVEDRQTGPSVRRRIWITVGQTPDSLTGEHPTVCHETPDSLTETPDSLTSDTIYRNRNEPIQSEPRGRDAREGPSTNGVAAKRINARCETRRPPLRHKSPYLSQDDFVDGYVPAGKGNNAVQVYYERFDITHDRQRLSDPQEDDLVETCADLDRLREVIIAYSRTNYKPGNIQLILDWYRDGVPSKHRSNGGNQNGRNKGHANGYSAHGGKPQAGGFDYDEIRIRGKLASGKITQAEYSAQFEQLAQKHGRTDLLQDVR